MAKKNIILWYFIFLFYFGLIWDLGADIKNYELNSFGNSPLIQSLNMMLFSNGERWYVQAKLEFTLFSSKIPTNRLMSSPESSLHRNGSLQDTKAAQLAACEYMSSAI